MPSDSAAHQRESDGWTTTLAPSDRCDYCGDEVWGSDRPSLDAAKEAHREQCPPRSAAKPLHFYEGRLSFRFEAEDDAEARKITRAIGDLGLQHPLAIDVAEEETIRV